MSVSTDLQPIKGLRWPSVAGAIGLFVVSIVAASLVILLLGAPSSPNSGELTVTLLAANVFPVALGGLALGSMLLRNREQRRVLRSFLTHITRPELRMTLLLVLALLPVNFGLSWLSSVFGVESQWSTLDLQVILHPLTIVTTFTLVPVAEELFFRGVLFGSLTRWGNSVAFVATLLISAMIHWPLSHVIGVLPGMALFTWLRMRTGRLGPSMLAHAVSNALVMALVLAVTVLRDV